MKLFRWTDASETLSGTRITWSLREGYKPLSFSVYRSDNGKEWILCASGLTVNFYLNPHTNYGIRNNYRVKCRTTDGQEEISDVIPGQVLERESRIIWKETRRRELVLMKAGRISAPLVYILIRRTAGKDCALCNPDGCGDQIQGNCPLCFGTGIEKGYFLWPVQEKMWLITPKNPKKEGPPDLPRDICNQSFRTIFEGLLKEGDLLVVGTTIYDIVHREVAASVGGAPMIYQLGCKELAPHEPRYDVLMPYIQEQVGDTTSNEC